MGTKFYMLNDPWHPNWLHKMNPQAPWKQIAPVFLLLSDALPGHAASEGECGSSSHIFEITDICFILVH